MNFDDETGLLCFVYKNKKQFIDQKLDFFSDLKDKIKLTDDLICIIVYAGIKDVYKYLDLNNYIKKFLNNLTNLKQNDWVEEVCWHIFRNIENSIESLPLYILKGFTVPELEKYIYNIIHYNLDGISCDGFLNFIEEKNIYIEDNKDFVEELQRSENLLETETVLLEEDMY